YHDPSRFERPALAGWVSCGHRSVALVTQLGAASAGLAARLSGTSSRASANSRPRHRGWMRFGRFEYMRFSFSTAFRWGTIGRVPIAVQIWFLASLRPQKGAQRLQIGEVLLRIGLAYRDQCRAHGCRGVLAPQAQQVGL